MYKFLTKPNVIPKSFFSKQIDYCLSLKSSHIAKSIHAQLIKLGLNSDTFLGTRCVELFSKLGIIGDALKAFDEIADKNVISWNTFLGVFIKSNDLVSARKVFDEMPDRDVVSFNSMISGYSVNGDFGCALEVFTEMQKDCIRPSESTFFILVSCVGCARSGKQIHGSMIRNGLKLSNVVLGNSLIDMYGKVGLLDYAFGVFDEIADKNVISWNICLGVFVESNDLVSARKLFDEMPDRDVVSFNSMISGYSVSGDVGCALEVFTEMQKDCIRPCEFTFSILVSCVGCARSGKQIHGSMIRNGVKLSNVVLGNSLINMYGKVGLLDYAFGVFLSMEKLNIISWNTLLSSCCKLGFEELALNQFDAMRAAGVSPDEFTLSTLTTVCSKLYDLEKGKKILALCIKLGFVSNTIVSSALIDLFSKCNRLDDSVRIFSEVKLWDSAVCNSLIASYAKHKFEEHAFRIFMLGLEKGLCPTEFTLSCLLSCSSVFPMETGSQLHSLVVKLGFESESVVASSLVEMYGKYGLINHASFIFDQMPSKDLICWNTMILGLTFNGEFLKSLEIFKEMLRIGQTPDHITLGGILMACNYGGLIGEGMFIFSLMEKALGVKPLKEHYFNLIEMMIRARKVKEAFDMLTKMPYEPDALILGSILQVVGDHGDFKLSERLANMIIELEPSLRSPYLVLIESYENQGRWESVSRIRKMMCEINPKKNFGCSWIGFRETVHKFQSNQIFHLGGSKIYSVLGLIEQDINNGWYILEQ